MANATGHDHDDDNHHDDDFNDHDEGLMQEGWVTNGSLEKMLLLMRTITISTVMVTINA